MIETDVNLTRDGELVIIHDPFLDRTTTGRGFVHDYTLPELLLFDAGSRFHPDFTGVCIPTCEETFRLFKDAGVQACFEIKGSSAAESEVIAEKLMTLFRQYNAFEWACISTYFPEAAARAHQVAPEVVVTRERLPDNLPFDLQDAVAQARILNSPVLLVDYKFLPPGGAQDLHAEGIAVWTWNPYQETDICQVIQQGSDGVMGDDPALARRLVDALQVA